MVASIFGNLKPSSIRHEPFPHAIIENALPEREYQELSETFPDPTYFGGGTDLGSNKAHRRFSRDVIEDPAMPAIWRDFIAYHSSQEFFDEVCDIWGDDIERSRHSLLKGYGKPLRDFTVMRRYPGKEDSPENQQSDIVLDCQFSINSPVASESSVRGPHLDNPFKLYAALLYFRAPGDDSTGGDFDIYRLKRGHLPLPKPSRIGAEHVERINRVHYRPNMLVFFVNTRHSLHGVTPRSITPVPRRYINFLGECYAGNMNGLFSPTNPHVSQSWRTTMTKIHRYRWALGV